MKNADLNAGHVIGAAVAAGLVWVVGIWFFGSTLDRLRTAIILAAGGGGLAGGWIRGKLRSSTVSPDEETPASVAVVSRITPPAQRVYRASGFLRWALSLTILPLGCLFLLIGVGALLSSGVDNKGTVILSSLITGALFLAIWLWEFRLRLEIGDDALRLTSMFGTKEIPLSQVAGYTLEASGLVQAIKLVDSSGRCLGRIHSHLAGFPSIVPWVENTFARKGGDR